ncbi:MAG: hypothetical protein ABJF10_21585 [Chthoniobacter sp.]|uniref:hypothetical protein n=1 Tax=Chthoniobacter sp. TaxID=2510640 RepID=UPI0032A457A5
MKTISNSLLPMLFSIAALSTSFAGPDGGERGGIPTRDLAPRCEKHYIDRTGTQVFRWDPVGADPRPMTVLCFDVDGAREYQRVPLHLGFGDVALVTACGSWQFSAGGAYYKFGPEGDGTMPETTLTGLRAAAGSLLMDVHYYRYSDRFVFSGPGQPIAVHGPCESITFIAHDQLVTRGVDSKGLLHVRIQILDSLLVAAGEGKEAKGYAK